LYIKTRRTIGEKSLSDRALMVLTIERAFHRNVINIKSTMDFDSEFSMKK